MIEHLPQLTPDQARSARTVTRCHRRLAVRRRRLESRQRSPKSKGLAVERFLAAGLCVAYLISMAGNILDLL